LITKEWAHGLFGCVFVSLDTLLDLGFFGLLYIRHYSGLLLAYMKK
jgi:hypothetical protein